MPPWTTFRGRNTFLAVLEHWSAGVNVAEQYRHCIILTHNSFLSKQTVSSNHLTALGIGYKKKEKQPRNNLSLCWSFFFSFLFYTNREANESIHNYNGNPFAAKFAKWQNGDGSSMFYSSFSKPCTATQPQREHGHLCLPLLLLLLLQTLIRSWGKTSYYTIKKKKNALSLRAHIYSSIHWQLGFFRHTNICCWLLKTALIFGEESDPMQSPKRKKDKKLLKSGRGKLFKQYHMRGSAAVHNIDLLRKQLPSHDPQT